MKESGSVIYYAMGGGLGHVTRSIAVLRAMKSIPFPVRMLASGEHAGLAAASSPVPMDIVQGGILDSWRRYTAFLESYIEKYRARALVLDTFPFGIAGEWLTAAPGLPRILIARSLKWDAYRERIGNPRGPMPAAALAIETLEPGYYEFLAGRCLVDILIEPILFQTDDDRCCEKNGKWLVVHSGSGEEQEALTAFAMEKMRELGLNGPEPDTLFPHRGIFPAQGIIRNYSTVVSGAGYNMAAMASQPGPGQQHFLFPFKRRFDDQHARLEALDAWKGKGDKGAQKTARWIEKVIRESVIL